MVLPLDHGFTAPRRRRADRAGHARRPAGRGARSAARAPTPSSPNWRRSRPATSSSTPTMASAAIKGLTSVPVSKAPHDCVALEYAGGDKLYVPVENIDVLTRYGSDSERASLDRLGGEAWQRRKSKMKERIREIAGELIKTAALRATRPGRVAETDSAFPQFVNRFPYEETDDQDRAIADVLDDLALGQADGPAGVRRRRLRQDRGRAARRVRRGDGRQPGRADRADHPARPPALQEFHRALPRLPDRDRAAVAPGAGGRGQEDQGGPRERARSTSSSAPTRCSARAIKFKKLGLVIVDEEQHFGVAHKEKLKALKENVHVLTLTATPIPRTLQMAMSGLRELSVIQTPPVDRLAVRTYVAPWDPVVVREALLREHYRGGQSFFVAPRVADLPDLEEWLREEVPEVKAVTAHGQMSPTEVEERMSAFYDGKYDVLLSTTIVESGLDIPTANTLDRPPRRPLRPGPALPAARPRRARQDPRLRLSDHARRTGRSPRPRPSGCRCSPISTASARASSSPATTSTSAAPAICSATSNRATSRRSGSSSTSRCSRTRSSRSKRGGLERRRGVHAADQRRCADPHPRGLCPRPRPAHGPLPAPGRA